jgi:hypothetical protein
LYKAFLFLISRSSSSFSTPRGGVFGGVAAEPEPAEAAAPEPRAEVAGWGPRGEAAEGAAAAGAAAACSATKSFTILSKNLYCTVNRSTSASCPCMASFKPISPM